MLISQEIPLTLRIGYNWEQIHDEQPTAIQEEIVLYMLQHSRPRSRGETTTFDENAGGRNSPIHPSVDAEIS